MIFIELRDVGCSIFVCFWGKIWVFGYFCCYWVYRRGFWSLGFGEGNVGSVFNEENN